MSRDDYLKRAAKHRLQHAIEMVRRDATVTLTDEDVFALWGLSLSAMPPRVSPDLIAKLNALASRLTAQGEYEACDLIDTVVERVSAMPGRELLAEALEALTPFAVGARSIDVDPPGDYEPSHGRGSVTAGHLRRARAAADKIRAALTQEKQT